MDHDWEPSDKVRNTHTYAHNTIQQQFNALSFNFRSILFHPQDASESGATGAAGAAVAQRIRNRRATKTVDYREINSSDSE